MTENEAKAVRFIENIKSHAMATLDYIAKEEPNVSPLVYKGREEKADTILTMIEELKQYRAIGTLEECRAAMEKHTAKKVIRREATDEDTENELREFITRTGMIFQCPFCGSYIVVNEMKNCWDCGQKLDWSEEE